jgi:hypothetical protein
MRFEKWAIIDCIPTTIIKLANTMKKPTEKNRFAFIPIGCREGKTVMRIAKKPLRTISNHIFENLFLVSISLPPLF